MHSPPPPAMLHNFAVFATNATAATILPICALIKADTLNAAHCRTQANVTRLCCFVSHQPLPEPLVHLLRTLWIYSEVSKTTVTFDKCKNEERDHHTNRLMSYLSCTFSVVMWLSAHRNAYFLICIFLLTSDLAVFALFFIDDIDADTWFEVESSNVRQIPNSPSFRKVVFSLLHPLQT